MSVDECKRVTDECRQVQTSHQTNVDECRQVQTSHQMSVGECRRVQTSHQTNVDESLDECRQMQTSLVVAIIQQQATSVCKFSILQFYLLLLLITVFSFLKLAKPICLFLHLMCVNSNLIDAQKTSQRKWKAPMCGGGGRGGSPPPPHPPSPQNINIY